MRLFQREFSERVEIGKGAQATVFRARQVSLDRHVLLKALSCTDQNEKRRLVERTKALSAVSFAGVPRIYQAKVEGDRILVAMEWFEGMPLSALPWHDWSLSLRLHVCLSCTEILSGIHSQSWAHGDLKPSNILITPRGQIKIIDMGMARKNSDRSSSARELAGTPAYLAPESVLEEPNDPRKADLYSLGLILAELLGRKRPTLSPSSGEIDLTPIEDQLGPFKETVSRCLEHDPADRAESAQWVHQRLCEKPAPVSGDPSAQLAAIVAPVSNGHMSHCLTQTARKMPRSKWVEKYKFLSEAIELDGDNGLAISLLEAIPSRAPKPGGLRRTAFAGLAIAALIAVIAVLVGLHSPQDSPINPQLPALEKEYLARAPRNNVPTQGQADFMDAGQGTGNAVFRMRELPSNSELFFQGRRFTPANGEITITRDAGEYDVIVKLDGETVWEKSIRLMPFQKVDIEFPDKSRKDVSD